MLPASPTLVGTILCMTFQTGLVDLRRIQPYDFTFCVELNRFPHLGFDCVRRLHNIHMSFGIAVATLARSRNAPFGEFSAFTVNLGLKTRHYAGMTRLAVSTNRGLSRN